MTEPADIDEAAKYTCAGCGDVFISGWSDEEARAEAEANFGDQLGDDPAVVCDPCFQAMTSAFPIADFLAQP